MFKEGAKEGPLFELITKEILRIRNKVKIPGDSGDFPQPKKLLDAWENAGTFQPFLFDKPSSNTFVLKFPPVLLQIRVLFHRILLADFPQVTMLVRFFRRSFTTLRSGIYLRSFAIGGRSSMKGTRMKLSFNVPSLGAFLAAS